MSFHIKDEPTIDESIQPASLRRLDRLALLVISGPDAGAWFQLPPEGGMIGRQADAVVRLADPGVSRRHAAIELDAQKRYLIRDLGSRNGVYVQGKLMPMCLLSDGDQVQLSRATMCRIRYGGPTETELMDELQRAATTDALTGVANRRYLMTRLEQELAFSYRHRVSLSVLLLDVDHFKGINDSWGHQAGDQVLKEVAQLLKANSRVEDVIARYGGDEFVVISRGYPPEDTVEFGRRLCSAARKTLFDVAGQQLSVTLSVGVAGCTTGHFDGERLGPMELLARADAALYLVKSAGRNDSREWVAPDSSAPDEANWARNTQVDLIKVEPST